MRLASCLLLLACVLLSGCAELGYYGGPGVPFNRRAYWRWDGGYAAYQEPVVVYVPVYPHHSPPPTVSAPEPIHHPFSAPSALAAIHAVDLAPCIARGAPHAYGHAQLTFLPDGGISNVLIDAPEGMSPDAVTCIGASLGAARAPAFDGAPMRVGATYYIH
jgi:hypothetical protein